MTHLSAVTNFNRNFDVIFANTELLKQEVFKIRYAVYVNELGWEPQNNNRMEFDHYDKDSLHCLLQHKRTGEYSGCVRIIIPPAQERDYELPFEVAFREHSITEVAYPMEFKRRRFAEVSRIVVSPRFRAKIPLRGEKLPADDIKYAPLYSEEERDCFSYVSTGLYLASLNLASICGMGGIFIMVEPRFKEFLTRFGLPFVRVGPEIDHHGVRALFYLPYQNFSSGLSPEMQELYGVIQDKLDSQINVPQEALL